MFEFIFLFLLCLISIIPFLFPAFLLFLKIFHRNTNKSEKINNIPRVTILIPAYNEENTIEETLNSILKTDYPNFNIIVVNDASTDNTFSKVKNFIQNNNVELILFSNSERIGKKNILNKYIPVINTDYVFILDANLHVEKSALKNMINLFDKNTGVIYGNLKLAKNAYSSITDEEIHYWNLETFLKTIQSESANITSPVGGFYILNKKYFETIPDDCNVEDMFVLLTILSKNKKSRFSKNSVAIENTAASTLHEFNRKKRIIRGGYFIIDYVFKNNIFKKLSKIDFAAFFLNKILRWIYPAMYALTFIFSIFSFRKNKAARIFFKLNLFLILATLAEFTFNSINNYINNKQRIRVHFFKKPLYFFMLIFAGVTALFEKSQHLWLKENR